MVPALRHLGGSATIPELYEAVVDEMKLNEEQLSVLHDPERGDQTEAAYRMAWARTYLKKAGFVTNSERGVWALTPTGREQDVDPGSVVEQVRAEYAARRAAVSDGTMPGPGENPAAELATELIPEEEAPEAHEMRPEYDSGGGVRGKHAGRYAKGSIVVVLDPDVAKAFPDSAAVNEALRALLPIIRRRRPSHGEKRSA